MGAAEAPFLGDREPQRPSRGMGCNFLTNSLHLCFARAVLPHSVQEVQEFQADGLILSHIVYKKKKKEAFLSFLLLFRVEEYEISD